MRIAGSDALRCSGRASPPTATRKKPTARKAVERLRASGFDAIERLNSMSPSWSRGAGEAAGDTAVMQKESAYPFARLTRGPDNPSNEVKAYLVSVIVRARSLTRVSEVLRARERLSHGGTFAVSRSSTCCGGGVCR